MVLCAVQVLLRRKRRRGVSIIAARLGDGPTSFLMQARAVAIDDPVLDSAPAPITLASQTGILSCPWCGCSPSRKLTFAPRGRAVPFCRVRRRAPRPACCKRIEPRSHGRSQYVASSPKHRSRLSFSHFFESCVPQPTSILLWVLVWA